jgi:hypothetical protein
MTADREIIAEMSLYEILGGLKAGVALACNNGLKKKDILRRLEELYEEIVCVLETHNDLPLTE